MFGRVSQRANPNLNINSRVNMPIKYSPPVTSSIKKPQPVVVNKNYNKPMKWGQPTWYFLHMLAQRVKDNEFLKIKDGLLRTIYLVCSNLPCPNCSEHAKMHLDKINFNNIKSKDELIKLLFSFHNIVNKRKDFPIFKESELVMYDKINIIICIQMFMLHFSDKSGSYKLMANDLYRMRIIDEVKKWLKDNMIHFE
jgi:hypothetical protein